MRNATLVSAFAWILAVLVTFLAILTWGQGFDWQFDVFSTYLLFPLFGLLAFSLMWIHYVLGATRRLKGVKKSVIQPQLKLTGYIVLVCILLHPGLLIWQLWRDGMGLPPGSYLEFVGQASGWAVTLGSVSLLAFLLFELKPRFQEQSWWPWIVRFSDVAMVAIFVHGLRLGGQTQTGWYQKVWWFYGITLVASLMVIYYMDKKARVTK